METQIRQAMISDFKSINELVSEVHKLHVKNRPDVYVDVDTPMIKEQFDELITSNDTKLFVVEDVSNKELVAYSIVSTITSKNIQILIPVKIAFIDDFCVKSSCHKQGIGRLLFEHVVNYAKTEGASSLQLVVWEFNCAAIKFYEALGMTTRNRRMELNL